MKALVITGSRADRNGLEVVHAALFKAGHGSRLTDCHGFIGEPDVAIIGGDRSEILQAALNLSLSRIPIAHIAGGDVTEGSADDRYRDAITALSCIHFATNEIAYRRLARMIRDNDAAYMTGSPAIDRIKQTPVWSKELTFAKLATESNSAEIDWSKPVALVCVHPNTVGSDPLHDCRAVRNALESLTDAVEVIGLGANDDAGGWEVSALLAPWCDVFQKNVSPQLYYSLMTHCDVMIGNSSAMLYESPCFGLPCVLVGDRQKGRIIPDNVVVVDVNPEMIVEAVTIATRTHGRRPPKNPYGDGKSAPRIVKALEENEWRWVWKTCAGCGARYQGVGCPKCYPSSKPVKSP